MNNEQIEVLQPSDTVVIGDLLRLTYEAGGVFAPAKRFLIQQRLSASTIFDVETIEHTGSEFVATVRVTENPILAGLIATAIVTVAATAFVFLTLVKVERIIKTPAGQIALAGLPVVVSVVVLAFLLPKLLRGA